MQQPPEAMRLESVQSDPKPQMTQSEIHRMFQIAQIHGGDFFQKLATAGLVADPDNVGKILRTWPEFESRYGPGSSFWEREQERGR